MNKILHSEIESTKRQTIYNTALNLVEILDKSNTGITNTKHIDFNNFRNRARRNSKSFLHKR